MNLPFFRRKIKQFSQQYERSHSREMDVGIKFHIRYVDLFKPLLLYHITEDSEQSKQLDATYMLPLLIRPFLTNGPLAAGNMFS